MGAHGMQVLCCWAVKQKTTGQRIQFYPLYYAICQSILKGFFRSGVSTSLKIWESACSFVTRENWLECLKYVLSKAGENLLQGGCIQGYSYFSEEKNLPFFFCAHIMLLHVKHWSVAPLKASAKLLGILASFSSVCKRSIQSSAKAELP